MVVFSEKLGVFFKLKIHSLCGKLFLFTKKNKKPTLDFVFAGKFFPEEKNKERKRGINNRGSSYK